MTWPRTRRDPDRPVRVSFGADGAPDRSAGRAPRPGRSRREGLPALRDQRGEERGEDRERDGNSEESGLQRRLHVGTPGAIATDGEVESGATLSRLSRVAGMARTRNVGRAPWLGHGTFVLRVRDDPVLRSRFGAPAHRFRRAAISDAFARVRSASGPRTGSIWAGRHRTELRRPLLVVSEGAPGVRTSPCSAQRHGPARSRGGAEAGQGGAVALDGTTEGGDGSGPTGGILG